MRRQEYNRTKHGLALQIHRVQRQKSKRRGHKPPTYTKQELEEWLMSQPLFHVLFDNWKRLDYQSDYKPSVDRIDDYIGYTISNIQLMTWKENWDKYLDDVRNRKNKKTLRPVEQYSLDGTFIKRFDSKIDAVRATGVNSGNMSKCLKGTAEKAGGFIWKKPKDL